MNLRRNEVDYVPEIIFYPFSLLLQVCRVFGLRRGSLRRWSSSPGEPLPCGVSGIIAWIIARQAPLPLSSAACLLLPSFFLLLSSCFSPFLPATSPPSFLIQLLSSFISLCLPSFLVLFLFLISSLSPFSH